MVSKLSSIKAPKISGWGKSPMTPLRFVVEIGDPRDYNGMPYPLKVWAYNGEEAVEEAHKEMGKRKLKRHEYYIHSVYPDLTGRRR